MNEEIRRLVEEWEEDVAVHSSTTIILAHPNHAKLVAMGMEAVPHIITLMRERSHLVLSFVLHEITGEQPIPPEDAGRVRRINEHWLKLAEEKGWG